MLARIRPRRVMRALPARRRRLRTHHSRHPSRHRRNNQRRPIRTQRRKRRTRSSNSRRPNPRRRPIPRSLPLLSPRLLSRLRPTRHRIESMSRILLADDSPHAQRMGERILREEGFEVVSLTDGDAALLRLADVDPDLILVDVFLPAKFGFDFCRSVKRQPRFKHVRVVLTAGLLQPLDEDEAKRAGCDAILKKPFEASKVLSTIAPLVKEAQSGRSLADTLTMAPLIPLP